MSERIEIHEGEATAFIPQCVNCINYLGDFRCKKHGEIDFQILGNETECPDLKKCPDSKSESNKNE